MRVSSFIRRQRRTAPVAALMAWLLLFLNMLVASPQLHERFHADANSSQHHCAVTLFAHGQVDAADADICAAAPAVAVTSCPQFTASIFSPAIENLPAGRGPPVLPAVS